jgi:hypothetical protein
VWDAEGTRVFDGPLDGATDVGGSSPSLTDPLTGSVVPLGGEDAGKEGDLVGYDTQGTTVNRCSTELDNNGTRISLTGIFHEQDSGNENWRARDLVGVGDTDLLDDVGIAGDFAFFTMRGVLSRTEPDGTPTRSYVVHIPDGKLVHEPDESCGSLRPDQAVTSLDNSKVVSGNTMYDSTDDVLTCDSLALWSLTTARCAGPVRRVPEKARVGSRSQ